MEQKPNEPKSDNKLPGWLEIGCACLLGAILGTLERHKLLQDDGPAHALIEGVLGAVLLAGAAFVYGRFRTLSKSDWHELLRFWRLAICLFAAAAIVFVVSWQLKSH